MPRGTGAILPTRAIRRLIALNVSTVDLWFEFGFPIQILIAPKLRLTVVPVVALVVARVVKGADPPEFPKFTLLVEV